ncbi:MAG: hypothetical protein QF632_03040 [Candidatus Woesearchaeota archaeon]|jgi:hypothetical protein|nr:hypothetical protein [Candidatus Woesearchaeota archaeon]
MKKRGILTLILLLLLVSLAYSVSNPRPTITVRYNETVTILARNLTYLDESPTVDYKLDPEADTATFYDPSDSGRSGSNDDEQQSPYFDYRFSVIDILPEGEYNFNITSEDDLGNEKNSSLNFTVKYTEFDIDIKKPTMGVSFDHVFNLTVNVSRTADCNHSRFDDEIDAMRKFNETNNQKKEHVAYNIAATGSSVIHHVKCKDELTEQIYSKSLTVRIDKTKPTLTVTSTPSTINEGTEFRYNITVETDDFTFCRWHATETDFDLMLSFDGTDYKKEHKQEFTEVEEGTFEYEIRCKNAVGLLSDVATSTFTADTSVATAINLVSPIGWVTNTPVDLTVSTTRNRHCSYDVGGGLVSFNEPSATTEHSKSISPEEGIHSYEISCRLRGEEEERSFEIKVDTTHPEKPVVTDDSDLVGNKEYTVRDDRLKAEIITRDRISKIVQFNYSIYNDSNDKLIFKDITRDVDCEIEDCTDTTDNSDCGGQICTATVIATGLDLQDKTEYYFKAFATDEAGLASLQSQKSDGIKVDKSKTPIESDDPTGWITKTTVSDGVLVRLLCSDTDTDASGCDSSSYKYDFEDAKADCTLQAYTQPVTVDKSGWFCWEVSDNADNTVDGAGEITVSAASTNDRDGDGELDTQDNCPDVSNSGQEDTDSDNIGDDCDNCPRRYNPSQYDSDSDDVGDSCDSCEDTPSGASADSSGCAPTQQATEDNDRDDDGIPNSWELQHGLDPDDPSDAALDNDGDGLTNLEEYTKRTNPNNKDTDGDGFDDKEEIDAGTDPLDSNSKPKKGSVLGTILLILGILIILGGAGYIAYLYFYKGETDIFNKLFNFGTSKKAPPPVLSPMQKLPPMRSPLTKRKTYTPGQQRLLMKRLLKKQTVKQAQRQKAMTSFGKLIPGAHAPTRPLAQPPTPKEPVKEESALDQIRNKLKGVKGKEDSFKRLSRLRKK